jgi:hypothetical protein
VEVRASTLNDQSTEKEPDVIQLIKNIISVSLANKYSKKIIHENIADINSKIVVTS